MLLPVDNGYSFAKEFHQTRGWGRPFVRGCSGSHKRKCALARHVRVPHFSTTGGHPPQMGHVVLRQPRDTGLQAQCREFVPGSMTGRDPDTKEGKRGNAQRRRAELFSAVDVTTKKGSKTEKNAFRTQETILE